MKSKFRYTAYFNSVISVFALFLFAVGFFRFVSKPDTPVLLFTGICTFLAFVWIWILFGELKTKIIRLDIEEGEVYVKRYLRFRYYRSLSC
ncbi:hypothetical protein HYN43_017665 [Mucilaginibacter celer]|uniref:Uncharacterized protein n=1 Tax=Mucilaginibacter celer TaxID=2305508 RepID=A0A494VZU9_9SPHI|nr:hypothetical protein HYN43_017665 [Mucilaginibacter celer]